MSDFDPRKHSWRFVSYYKYTFTFVCDQDPRWHASYGGDRDQIYSYSVDAAGGRTWAEITEGTCESDEDVASTCDEIGIGHEFVRIWRTDPRDPSDEGARLARRERRAERRKA